MPPSPKSGGVTSCDYVMYMCSYDRVKPGIKSNLVHQHVILENRASLYCCTCRATHFKYNNVMCIFLVQVDPFSQLILYTSSLHL